MTCRKTPLEQLKRAWGQASQAEKISFFSWIMACARAEPQEVTFSVRLDAPGRKRVEAKLDRLAK